jgi:hypothetical protein
LAEFLVHALAAAHTSRVRIERLSREGALRLTIGQESLYPDAAFDVVDQDRRQFRFYIEIDCSSERILSHTASDSIERKICFYNRLQDSTPDRFRVLFVVASGSQVRAAHLVDAAAQLTTNTARTLVCAATLPTFLSREHALTAPLFLDHHRQYQSLIPAPKAVPRRRQSDSHRFATLPQLLPS